MKTLRLSRKQWIFLVSVFACLFSTDLYSADKNCDDVYIRGELLGKGANKNVYLVDSKKTDGSCWDLNCSNVVVKEIKSDAPLSDSKIEQEIAKLKVSVLPLATGKCLLEGNLIHYEIEQKLVALSKDKVREKPRFYQGKIQRRLDTLHKNNFIHGDVHVGNILISEDGKDVFLADFDHAKDLRTVKESSKQGHIDFENFYASKIWTEEIPWQPLFYRYKSFDIEHSGKIEGKQLDTLSRSIGNWELAVAISKIYNFEFSLHSDPHFRKAFFLDLNNDGILDFKDIKKEEAPTNFQELAEAYQDYVQTKMINPYTIVPADRAKGKRVVSDRAPYNANFPLKAKDILIISGGDVNEARPFPVYSQNNYKKLAANFGYSTEFFNGNLARKYPYWHKILMLIDKLRFSSNKVVVWLDDDGIVNTDSDMIEKYLSVYKDSDLIIVRDPEDFAYVNTGFMIVRNTPNSMRLLHQLLEIGLEGRTSKDDPENNWFASSHLLKCKQAYHCLHEQQAFQELLQLKKRVFNNKVENRNSDVDWSKHVAVIPQIDEHRALNANLLLMDGSETKLMGRNQSDKIVNFHSTPYYSLLSLKEKKELPFFVQCAGFSQDKTTCVRNLAQYESGEYESALNHFPPGNYKAICTACSQDDEYLTCQCMKDNKWVSSSVNLSCNSNIDNVNGRLLCKDLGNNLQECSEIYKKNNGNSVGTKRVDGSCWNQACEEGYLKEYTDDTGYIFDQRAFDLAQKLGVAPPEFESGHCTVPPSTDTDIAWMKSYLGYLDSPVLHYRIEKKLTPLNDYTVISKAQFYLKKVIDLVNTLHKSNILHGNLRIQDVLVDENDQVYLARIEQSRLINAKDAKKLKYFAQENFAVSKLWIQQHQWHPFFYKYKVFDTNLDFQISGDELQRLQDITNTKEEAQTIAWLYSESIRKMGKLKEFFSDLNNDGILDENELHVESFMENALNKIISNIGFQWKAQIDSLAKAEVAVEAKNTYERKYQEWRRNYFIFEPEYSRGKRLISKDYPYDKVPLKAEDILIISGGDVNAKRSFPLLSRENFRQFAENLGYHFQHYSGNLAYPALGYWNKIYMLIDKLADSRNRVVVWLDDDGAVNLKSNMIERYLSHYPSKDVIVAKDPEEFAYVNTGALIVRNTPNSLLLLRNILEVGYSDSAYLRLCSQSGQCLHEQQALQELLEGKRGSKNWYEIVEVVPQIDTDKDMNMNFLLKDGLNSDLVGQGIRSRRERYPVERYTHFKEDKTVEFPFFVQCADAHQDKYICLSGIMEIQEKGFTKRVLNLPNGSYQNKCRCLVDDNILKCTCNGRNVEFKLPCQEPAELEFDNNNLRCRQRDNIIQGPYTKRCSECFIEDGLLVCGCVSHWSKLKLPCGDEEEISSVNDILKCTDILKPLPNGSYKKKCNSCTYTKNTLACACPEDSKLSKLEIPCDGDLDIGVAENKLACLPPLKNNPKGSYTSHCKECEYRADSLSCKCKMNLKSRQEKKYSLNIPCPEGEDIAFFQDKLVCAKALQTLPDGNYKDTCKDCQYRASTLFCSCDRDSYYYELTNLELPCDEFQEIRNQNGALKCVDVVRKVPQGPFTKDCDDCSFRGKTLKCTCANKAQSLKLPCPDGKEIRFRGGKLQCLDPSQTLPKGLYSKTCEQCYFDGESLECKCSGTYTSKHFSKLKIPCEEFQNIENIEGTLTCQHYERPLPEGSYKDGFENCKFLGNTLSCKYLNNHLKVKLPCPDGEEVRLNHLASPPKLECAAISQPLPAGDYQDSCKVCYNDGKTLSCVCRDTSYDNHSSSLGLPCEKKIKNTNGKLQCK